jgi:hypothetical protein
MKYLGSLSGGNEQLSILGYNAVQSVESRALLGTCFLGWFPTRLVREHEDGGDIFLRNVG